MLQAERRALQRRRRMLRRTVLDRISSQRSLSLSDADTRSVDSKDDSRDDTPHLDDKMRAVLLMPSFRLVPMLRFTSAFQHFW